MKGRRPIHGLNCNLHGVVVNTPANGDCAYYACVMALKHTDKDVYDGEGYNVDTKSNLRIRGEVQALRDQIEKTATEHESFMNELGPFCTVPNNQLFGDLTADRKAEVSMQPTRA
jgi:hypothetical protein